MASRESRSLKSSQECREGSRRHRRQSSISKMSTYCQPPVIALPDFSVYRPVKYIKLFDRQTTKGTVCSKSSKCPKYILTNCECHWHWWSFINTAQNLNSCHIHNTLIHPPYSLAVRLYRATWRNHTCHPSLSSSRQQSTFLSH